MIGWRQSKTTGETVHDKLAVRQFAQTNSGLLAGDDRVLHPDSTYNDKEVKKEAEDKRLHRMAKVRDFWEIWKGSQTLLATPKKSRALHNHLNAVGYISDTEEIVKASRSNFHRDCLAAFKLSEKSLVPPALSAKDLPGGRTQRLNMHRIKQIGCHPAESNEDSLPKSISDTEN